MPARKYSVEQIVAKLREAERLQGQGLSIAQVCKRLGISDQTFFRWKVRGAEGGRGGPAPQGLGAGERPPEEDRGRAGPGHLHAQGPRGGDLVSPARRRDAVAYPCRRHHISERRACRLLAQHRSTQRYVPLPNDHELRLVTRMNALADQHPRYGYRRVWALLRAEGWASIASGSRACGASRATACLLAGPMTPGRARGEARNAPWNHPATRPNHVWSYDFVTTRTRMGLARGRASTLSLRCHNIRLGTSGGVQ